MDVSGRMILVRTIVVMRGIMMTAVAADTMTAGITTADMMTAETMIASTTIGEITNVVNMMLGVGASTRDLVAMMMTVGVTEILKNSVKVELGQLLRAYPP